MGSKSKRLAASIAGTWLMVASASVIGLPAVGADSNAVANGSFETPTVTSAWRTYGAGNPAITGWTIDSGSVDHIGGYWSAADGSQSIDLDGLAPGSISQELATDAGGDYTISFSLAGNPDGTCDGSRVRTLEVLWDGVSVGVFEFDTTLTTREAMGWESKTTGVVTATGATTTLTFRSLDVPNCMFGPALDAVRVDPLLTCEITQSRAAWEAEGFNVIVGTDGPDTLTGTSGNDLIIGLAGDDLIVGGEGDDLICADAGDDVVRGNQGDDTVIGGAGDDELHGDDGDDLLTGSAGNDSLYGSGGDDRLVGSAGDDLLEGEDGTDTGNGSSGTDTCIVETAKQCEIV